MSRAIRGAPAAVRELADSPAPEVDSHRIAPLLTSIADGLGIGSPEVERWRGFLRESALRHLLLRDTIARTGAALDRAGIPWLVCKGVATAGLAFERPEHRPTSDLDVLVAEDSLDEARATLEADGWRTLHPGPRAERYLRTDGYAWQAVGPCPGLLELHFRLWGTVPPRFTERLLARSGPAGEGTTELHADPADHYLLSVLHLWQTEPPRPLIYPLEQCRLLDLAGADGPPTVIGRATADGLTLPLALAALLGARLFEHPPSEAVLEQARQTLRPPERLVLRRAERTDPLGIPLAPIVLARLLSGRPSRAGWRPVWRRAWAHPATVERETAPHLPWPARRLRHMAGRLAPGLSNREQPGSSPGDSTRGPTPHSP